MRNEKSWVVAGLSLAAAMMTFTGCQTAPKDGRSAGLALDDKHITGRVKESLETEPVYKFTNVDVKTFAGTVQLSGFVMTQGQKNRAQEIAQHTEGVREVVNAITLKPAMPGPTVAPVVSPASRSNAESTIYQTPASPSTAPSSSTQPENKASETTEPK
jgi:Predicted periplasmic or secreted lipoprotein